MVKSTVLCAAGVKGRWQRFDWRRANRPERNRLVVVVVAAVARSAHIGTYGAAVASRSPVGAERRFGTPAEPAGRSAGVILHLGLATSLAVNAWGPSRECLTYPALWASDVATAAQGLGGAFDPVIPGGRKTRMEWSLYRRDRTIDCYAMPSEFYCAHSVLTPRVGP